MASDLQALRRAVREAARAAFTSVREAHPGEHFYYYALVTTSDALRPGPSVSSSEALERVLAEQGVATPTEDDRASLRWSEADSPYNLWGDEFFGDVQRLFLEHGEHRELPDAEYEAELKTRLAAMELALRDLDTEGFFGSGLERERVVINVVAPGDEDEIAVLEKASRLNPPESLRQIRKDLGQQ